MKLKNLWKTLWSLPSTHTYKYIHAQAFGVFSSLKFIMLYSSRDTSQCFLMKVKTMTEQYASELASDN